MLKTLISCGEILHFSGCITLLYNRERNVSAKEILGNKLTIPSFLQAGIVMISNEDAKLYAKLREEQPETFKISQTAGNL